MDDTGHARVVGSARVPASSCASNVGREVRTRFENVRKILHSAVTRVSERVTRIVVVIVGQISDEDHWRRLKRRFTVILRIGGNEIDCGQARTQDTHRGVILVLSCRAGSKTV